ncbi:unnamed protein product [Owenia fusiformis]|uniref:Uncharacterized protein n=1 Tax=Owenia fusiformis TaxID=6347 RepID=A0A8S4Q8A7_OWEFU|nr:unnamed protein product [Owenia fusiformis]
MSNTQQASVSSYFHNQDEHQRALESLCRLCSSKRKSSKQNVKARSCILIQSELSKICPSIKLDEDEPLYHPSKVCEKCYRLIKDLNRRKRQIPLETLTLYSNVNKKWIENDSEKCWTCEVHQSANPFQKSRKRSFETSLNEEDFARDISMSHSTPKKRCNVISDNDASTCMTPGRGRDATIRDILQKPSDQPLSVLEDKLLTSLVKRKLNHSRKKEELHCKTGGKVIILYIKNN